MFDNLSERLERSFKILTVSYTHLDVYKRQGLALCGAAAQAQEKPNFLIIQCDHLTHRVVGA